MSGQPRSRIARRLTWRMAGYLHVHGPTHLDDLLTAFGYGPEQPLGRVERAAVRMATRELLKRPSIEELDDGRLAWRSPSAS